MIQYVRLHDHIQSGEMLFVLRFSHQGRGNGTVIMIGNAKGLSVQTVGIVTCRRPVLQADQGNVLVRFVTVSGDRSVSRVARICIPVPVKVFVIEFRRDIESRTSP